MAKKRKTRQEKKIADLRRQITHSVVSSALPDKPTYSLHNVISTPQISTPNHKLPITHNSYVLYDLRKTGILTLIALATQIILYFVLMK